MESIKVDNKCCKLKSVNGYCPKPLENINSFLTKKWAISIIVCIGNFEKLRFNDILEKLEEAKPKILSLRLKDLEKEEIVVRKEFNERPPRVEYSLSKKGKELFEALKPLIDWAEGKI